MTPKTISLLLSRTVISLCVSKSAFLDDCVSCAVMGSCCSPDLPAQLLAPRALPVTPVIRGRVSNRMLEKCRSAVLLGCLDSLDWYWGELAAPRRAAGSVGLLVEPLQCWWSLSGSCRTPASPSTADTRIGNLHLTLSDVSKQSSQ